MSQIPPKERLWGLTMRTLQMLGSVACAAKAAGKAPLSRGVSFGSYRFLSRALGVYGPMGGRSA